MSAYREPGEVPSKCLECGCHAGPEPVPVRYWKPRVATLAVLPLVVSYFWQSMTSAMATGVVMSACVLATVPILQLVDWMDKGCK